MDIRHGEIIGIAGISGNGQEELAEVLSGEWRSGTADAISLHCPLTPQTRGLLGMEERARMFGGSLEIVSGEREGTTVAASIPY